MAKSNAQYVREHRARRRKEKEKQEDMRSAVEKLMDGVSITVEEVGNRITITWDLTPKAEAILTAYAIRHLDSDLDTMLREVESQVIAKKIGSAKVKRVREGQ